MNTKKGAKWFMAGTEKTGKYVVVVQGSLGRVGYRDIGGGKFRVRVEPVDMAASTVMAPSFQGWKQPDSQMRFSTVVYGAVVNTAINAAVKAIAKANHLETNPKAPKWAKELVKTVQAEVEAKASEAAKKAATPKKVAKPKAPKKATTKKATAKKPAKIKKAA